MRWEKVAPHPCKGCGVETDNPGYCSTTCFQEHYVKPIRFPKPSQEELEQTLRDLKTITEAAAKYGVSTRTFITWLESYGIKHDKPRGREIKVMPPEFVETVNKYGAEKAAEMFNVSPNTAGRWIKELLSPDLVSLATVGRALGYSRVTPSVWHRLGLIPGIVKIGKRRIMVPKAILQKMKHAMRRHKIARVRVTTAKPFILCVPNIGQDFANIKGELPFEVLEVA